MEYCKVESCSRKPDVMSSAGLCFTHAKQKAELDKDPNGLALKVMELLARVEQLENDVNTLGSGLEQVQDKLRGL